MAKDINIHLKTKGGPQTKQQLNEVGQSAKKVGDSVSQGGKTGADGIDKMSDAAAKGPSRFARLSSSIKSWAFGLVGITAVIAGITSAIRAQKQALEEHGRIAAEQQKKMLALQGMGTFFEEHPQARKRVAAYSEFGRRPFEEVAEAWYTLESKGAGLTKKQKEGIMKESLELGRMEPEADLKGIVEMFSLYAKESGEKDINKIQNVLRETMTKAGAELSEIARYLPEFLSLGIAGGLPAEEVAGLWAYATTRTKEPSKATVGIRNVFAALQGKGTPESQEIMQQMGITPEMDFYEQIEKLSEAQRAGKFGVPEAEAIAGRENIAVLLSMLTDPQAMMQSVRDVSSKARSDIDTVKSKLDLIMAKDDVARLEEEGRRLDIAIANEKGQDIRALRLAVELKKVELDMRKQGKPEIAIIAELATRRTEAALGLDKGLRFDMDAVERGDIGPAFGGGIEGLEPSSETETTPETEPPKPKEAETVPPSQPPAQPEEKSPASKEVAVPVQPVSKETQINVPVEAVADKQQVGVPVEAVVDMQRIEVPVQPVVKDNFQEQVPMTVVHNHFNYDHSIRYYPRVGDTEIGPRIGPMV